MYKYVIKYIVFQIREQRYTETIKVLLNLLDSHSNVCMLQYDIPICVNINIE